MGVIDQIKGVFKRAPTVKEPSRAEIKAAVDYLGFEKWFSPHNIFARLAGHELATNENIFAVISRLSNTVAAMPVKLLEKGFKEVDGHTVGDLIAAAPNPNQHSLDFFRSLEALRNTSGNAYALIDYDDRFRPRALWILDPGKVEPVVEKNTRELWYEIQGDQNKYYAHNMDVLHVKHIHGFGYKGISPIEVLRGSSEFDKKVRELSLDQIDGAVTASFILKLATSVGKEKKQEILDSFRDFYQNNGGVLIQEMGVDIDPVKQDFIDTKLFDVEKITRSRVANVFQVPLHLLGEISGVQASNLESMDLAFLQGTMLPIVRQYEMELNRKLLTREERSKGYYFKFNLNALLRGDMKSRGEFYFKGIRSGWFTPNEVRALEDYRPLGGGDELYMSKDLQPIGAERNGDNG